jgi:hypothetical protein
MRYISILFRRLAAMSGMVLLIFSINDGGAQAVETYSQNEILTAAENLFGATTKGLATVVEKVFQDLGLPNG